MMFSCCHPRLPEEAQVALVLNILCGFGAGEIASAFLTGRAAIEKRISRGKKVLAGAHAAVRSRRTPSSSRALRRPARAVSAVQRGLPRRVRRGGGARRAVRRGDAPDRAAARAPAGGYAGDRRARGAHVSPRRAAARARRRRRRSEPARSSRIARAGTRDSSRRGSRCSSARRAGTDVTAYHVEAAIAAAHAGAPQRSRTPTGRRSSSLYDRLLTIAPSPVVALNRAIAIAQRDGAERGLAALHAIDDRERLARYPFYPAALGELELRRGHLEGAPAHFRRRSHSRAIQPSAGFSRSGFEDSYERIEQDVHRHAARRAPIRAAGPTSSCRTPRNTSGPAAS